MIDHHFLSRVMCGTGPYCLWTARRTIDAEGTPTKELADRKQTFYQDLPDLLTAAAGAFANDREVYFAMASFKDTGSREASNIQGLKCFFFDLDCRPGKEYSSKVEALQALRNFCTRNALPKPLLVDSGGGIHGYWILDREVSYAEWSPVAERYKAACLQQGFLMDMAVPADGARILRLPGTANFKDLPPSPRLSPRSPGVRLPCPGRHPSPATTSIISPCTCLTFLKKALAHSLDSHIL